MQNDPRLLLLSQEDNIFVLRNAVEAGETIYVEQQQIRFQNIIIREPKCI